LSFRREKKGTVRRLQQVGRYFTKLSGNFPGYSNKGKGKGVQKASRFGAALTQEGKSRGRLGGLKTVYRRREGSADNGTQRGRHDAKRNYLVWWEKEK